MAYDLTDLRAQVSERAKVANSSLVTTTVLDRAINRALHQISLERDWPWLYVPGTLAVVAGTVEYTPPALWRRTAVLTHQDTGETLVRRHIRVIDTIPPTVTGRPYLYAVSGGLITIKPYPALSETLIHRYIKTEPTLVNAGDTPLIPEAYCRGIVEYAAIKIFQVTSQTTLAQEAKADYQAWLNTVKDDVNQSRDSMRVEVRPSSWF